MAVLEARGGDALRAYGRQLLGALYGTTALAKLNDGWVDARGSCVALIAAAGFHEIGLIINTRYKFRQREQRRGITRG